MSSQCSFPPVGGAYNGYGYSLPPMMTTSSMQSVARSQKSQSSWDGRKVKEICNGCPPRVQPRGCFPPIQPSGCCIPVRGSGPSSCGPTPPPEERCRLPLVNHVQRKYMPCGNHPREDCCRIPQMMCPPRLPICPVGTYVERVQSMKPNDYYEPPTAPLEGCSTYRTSYVGLCGLPAVSVKPSNYVDPPSGKMADLTMYREQFTCKPIIPVEQFRNKNEYVPSCAPMEGCSTYRVDYKGCCGRPAESLKPRATFEASSGKMEGCSTYRHEFIPYCPAEYDYARGNASKPTDNNSFSCSPMEGCSTYRLDFVPKCSEKRPSMKQLNQTGFSTARFGGASTYKNDFLPFHFTKCPGPCIPQECYDPCCC